MLNVLSGFLGQTRSYKILGYTSVVKYIEQYFFLSLNINWLRINNFEVLKKQGLVGRNTKKYG
jgi:hypothetical protein